VPIAITQNLVQVVEDILLCKAASLPIHYMGLSLSGRKLSKIAYQPLIQDVQDRLNGWQGVFLSPGGRTTLAKAVLSLMNLK
jgi:hypothetical protein